MNAPTSLSALRGQHQTTTAGKPPAAAPKRSMSEIAKMPRDKQFPALLESLQGEIKRALPAHLNPDRMARIALTCFRTTPKLALCEPSSVFAAVMQASQLGLEPGLLGQCYLIPYKDQCQLQIGYQGLVDLARRSGKIVSLEAHCVYTKDVFECSLGLDSKLRHEPHWDGDRGDFRLAYAVAHLKDGGTHIEVMGRHEIERIRDRSQNVQSAKRYGKQTPWDTDFAEMARKTVLRRITKFLPKSVELAQAIALDEAASFGRSQDLQIDDVIEGTWTPVHVDDEQQDEQATDSAATGAAPADSQQQAPAGGEQAQQGGLLE